MKKQIELNIASAQDAQVLHAQLTATAAGRDLLAAEHDMTPPEKGKGAGLYLRMPGAERTHVWHRFAFDPTHLDIEAKRAFTQGWCWLLALEIASATGWPLVVIARNPRFTKRADVINDWRHVFVRMPSGNLLDVNGIHTPDQVRAAGSTFGRWPSLARISRTELARDGRRDCDAGHKLAAYNLCVTRRTARTLVERLVREAAALEGAAAA